MFGDKKDHEYNQMKTVTRNLGKKICEGEIETGLRYLRIEIDQMENDRVFTKGDMDAILKHLCEITKNHGVYHPW